jgi:hypothetical protein
LLFAVPLTKLAHSLAGIAVRGIEQIEESFMNGKWWSIVVLFGVAGLLLGVNSCGHDQQLVSIQIQPAVETVGATNVPVNENAGIQMQLSAVGTYIHPPVAKDITSQVTWASNDTQMFTISSSTPGLLTTTGDQCGSTLVSASLVTNTSAGGISSSGAAVIGYMTASVVCFSGSGSGGATSPVLTLTFGGSGAGTVTSSPSGLSCASPTPCLSQFGSGTLVTLTATPTGSSTFGSWLGCNSAPSTNPCTVTLIANQTVTATFN